MRNYEETEEIEIESEREIESDRDREREREKERISLIKELERGGERMMARLLRETMHTWKLYGYCTQSRMSVYI